MTVHSLINFFLFTSSISILSITIVYFNIRNYDIALPALVQIQALVTCIMCVIIIAFQKLPGFMVSKRTDNELSGICKLFIKY